MTKVLVADGPDRGVAWHFGDPLREQRWLDDGSGLVNLANREVVQISGSDRARFLNLLGTQKLDDLKAGQTSSTFFLDPQGHVDHWLALAGGPADSAALWGWTEPGRGAGLAEFLNRRRFRLDVEVRLRPDIAVVWSGREPAYPARSGTPNCLGGYESFVPRTDLAAVLAQGQPVGLWAYTARRIAAGIVRVGVDTDERTIPNEVGVPSENLALDKGCYPGQETVAKVHNLGTPPRRLVRLHLDGSPERFPEPGTPLTESGSDKVVGRLGSMAYHCELGPIGLGLIASATDDQAVLLADGVPATIEPLVAVVKTSSYEWARTRAGGEPCRC